MNQKSSRRSFIRSGTAASAGLLTLAAIDAAAEPADKKPVPPAAQTTPETTPAQQHQHGASTEAEFPRTRAGRGGPVGSATDRGKLVAGRRNRDEKPVVVETPDITKLFWEMKDGVKEFHLVAEHVRREVLPEMWFDFWGYNGSMPGPTIEAVEGDRVRIVVHNKLPEATTVHWHGIELPIAMDGVHGITQEPIPSGGTFAYEFDLHQDGTFFYHSHGPMQEIMGMTGLFIVHPRQTYAPTVDHDFGLIVQEFAVLPQNSVPNSVSEEFNFFTINGRSGPFTTPLVVRLGSRVRIRFMNLSAMDNHPMHLHGHTFWITGTEGGRIPDSAWIPSNNVLVAVGQSRDVEFIANNPGDWMIHCHILHHMMNHMVSMSGPMVEMNRDRQNQPADGMRHRGTSPETRGGEYASGELGAGLEPSLGPTTGLERSVMNGMRPSDMKAQFQVPGYPQDMMEMHGMLPPEQVKKLKTPLTRGMRQNWYTGTQAMMTILRVLPDDLYERVVFGIDEIEPGASTPGAGPGVPMGQGGHTMPGNPSGPMSHDTMQHGAHGKPNAQTAPATGKLKEHEGDVMPPKAR